MISKENKNNSKLADSEDYDVNHPQNIAAPSFNSTTEHRDTNELPGVENLNHQNQTNDELKDAKSDSNDPSEPKNEKSLRGEESKTDLGNGQRDDDTQEEERIIRT